MWVQNEVNASVFTSNSCANKRVSLFYGLHKLAKRNRWLNKDHKYPASRQLKDVRPYRGWFESQSSCQMKPSKSVETEKYGVVYEERT